MTGMPAGYRCPPPCGKVRHRSRAAARAIEKRSRRKHGRQTVYPCQLFGGIWHIGHSGRTRRNRARRDRYAAFLGNRPRRWRPLPTRSDREDPTTP